MKISLRVSPKIKMLFIEIRIVPLTCMHKATRKPRRTIAEPGCVFARSPYWNSYRMLHHVYQILLGAVLWACVCGCAWQCWRVIMGWEGQVWNWCKFESFFTLYPKMTPFLCVWGRADQVSMILEELTASAVTFTGDPDGAEEHKETTHAVQGHHASWTKSSILRQSFPPPAPPSILPSLKLQSRVEGSERCQDEKRRRKQLELVISHPSAF